MGYFILFHILQHSATKQFVSNTQSDHHSNILFSYTQAFSFNRTLSLTVK
jgi:hypothetical protein